MLVPRLADWCAVDLIGQDGLIHRLAVVHLDPAKAEAADQLRRRYPIIDPHREHTITKLLRRGQSWFDPEVSETRLAAEPAMPCIAVRVCPSAKTPPMLPPTAISIPAVSGFTMS